MTSVPVPRTVFSTDLGRGGWPAGGRRPVAGPARRAFPASSGNRAAAPRRGPLVPRHAGDRAPDGRVAAAASFPAVLVKAG